MSYQAEIRAKLDAANSSKSVDHDAERYSDKDVDQMIVNELTNEFNLAQYDLHESDIVRAIKIEALLEPYRDVFKKLYALKVFYAIGKAGAINMVTLKALINRTDKAYETIVSRMIDLNLVYLNKDEEIQLTDEGKSLAERIGIDIFI
ncbi:MAG: hypothetical protein U9Q62_10740 [Campylobacterota bacterium]|nr:hypothetical protein [Campylobacterota bacterium]